MFQIFCDSAANLPAVTAKQYNIHIISFVNTVNGQSITCFDPDLTPEEERAKGTEYYNAIREGAEVKTSLVNTDGFIEAFRPTLEAGEDLIYFSLSKNISGTYNAARLAAEELKDEIPERTVYLVDSLNASLAQGILAVYASEMRDAGRTPDSIAAELSEKAHQMNGVFTVDNLKYLARTGRISSTTAVVGNVLNVKPILRGNGEGFIVQYDKIRGRKKVLNELVRLVCDHAIDPENQIIGIAHADAYEESLTVMNAIQDKLHCRGFINTSYDFCTGSHVGPGAIALFFLAKDRRLDKEDF